MTTHFKDYNQSFTGSDMESLSQSLQDLVSENPASVVNLQLTFLTRRTGRLSGVEESNRRTPLGLMSAHVGKSLHLGEHTHEELTAAFDATMANWNLYLFDGFGSYDPDVIYNRIEYLASGLDCRIIFLDHLSILLSGLDGDERRMIDTTMTKLRSLVERTGIALFLVSHLKRTSSDQNHEEGARVTLGQLQRLCSDCTAI